MTPLSFTDVRLRTAARYRQVEELFDATLEYPTSERSAYLHDACGGDSLLRAEVESLIDADRGAGTFIEAPARERFPDLSRANPDPLPDGRKIGAYQLVRVIASGGMGTVYEAEQDQPRRTVALKVMKTGLGSPSALRRFEYESQILARLRHPGIAQVYEAGAHHEGDGIVPYFAMEYVPGARTLLEYAELNRLSTRHRLELFIQVCEAVHHAHQKGVLHRDLKPGNILVPDEDVDKLNGRTIETNVAGRHPSPLTPHPSRFSAQPKIIDFGVARGAESDFSDTLVRIDVGQLVGTLQYMSPEQCDADPENLDTRSDVYSLGLVLFELLTDRLPYEIGKTSISIATQIIKNDPPKRLSEFNARFRGDLDTVVLKALEKDRERRYASAADLARDVQRYLSDHPIEARPSSPLYQFRKLVARHKPLSAALTVLMVSLAGFAVGMTLLYRHAELNWARAERAETSSRSEAKAAREVSEYLVNLFRTLDPWASVGTDESSITGLPVLELLDREARALSHKLRGQPLTQAEVLTALAGVYVRMELYGRAAAVLRRAVSLRRESSGADDAMLASDLESLSDTLRRKGEFDAAEPPLQEALAIRQRIAAADPARRAEATRVLANVALLALTRGRLTEAVALFREVRQARRTAGGEDDPLTLLGLANTLRLSGDPAAAEPLVREALERSRQQPGLTPHLVSALNSLSNVRRDRGDFAGAEALLWESVRAARELKGPECLEAIAALPNIALLLKSQGRLDAAEALLREALAKYRSRFGMDHPSAGSVLYHLLHVLAEKGDAAGLEAIDRELRAQAERAALLPDDHPLKSGAALHLGVMKLYQNDAAGAEPLLRECVELRQKALSPQHWLTAYAESVLGKCLAAQGRFEEAEPLLLNGEQVIRSYLGSSDDRALRARRRLVEFYSDRSGPVAETETSASSGPLVESNPS